MAILGSTGSIGRQALDVIRAHPERFEVAALSAWSNTGLLAQQVAEFGPRYVSTPQPEALRARLGEIAPPVVSLVDAACAPEVDVILSAVVGKEGLQPALNALKAGKTVALANKEAMIMAGRLLKAAVAEGGGELRPVDSEHSAIWQCLGGEDATSVQRLIITASGGALRDLPLDTLEAVTAERALAHPTWSMGRKITIDCATLFNKGLEVIEAHLLFDVPYERIDVLMHRESIIHSMVEMVDGSFKAHLSSPDMRPPIQYALAYPDRLELEIKPLDLAAMRQLSFGELDMQRYPCLATALEAGRRGATYPAAVAAADEEAVGAFLDGRIGFLDMSRIIEGALNKHSPGDDSDLASILEADAWGRRFALQWIQER